jgi:hypothetical protein
VNEREQRAIERRQANAEAARTGRPLPHPNPWDALDPTKLDAAVDADAAAARYRAFCKLCPPRRWKTHVL